MRASGPVPILSRVQSWDTDHLAEAATNWSNTASLWEDTFAQVSRQMALPRRHGVEGSRRRCRPTARTRR